MIPADHIREWIVPATHGMGASINRGSKQSGDQPSIDDLGSIPDEVVDRIPARALLSAVRSSGPAAANYRRN